MKFDIKSSDLFWLKKNLKSRGFFFVSLLETEWGNFQDKHFFSFFWRKVKWKIEIQVNFYSFFLLWNSRKKNILMGKKCNIHIWKQVKKIFCLFSRRFYYFFYFFFRKMSGKNIWGQSIFLSSVSFFFKQIFRTQNVQIFLCGNEAEKNTSNKCFFLFFKPSDKRCFFFLLGN